MAWTKNRQLQVIDYISKTSKTAPKRIYTKDNIMENINALVDQLGKIDAIIKENEAIARKLKAELIAKGVGKYAGDQYVAEVQHYDRATINPILVREFGTTDFVAQVTQHKPVDAVVVRVRND